MTRQRGVMATTVALLALTLLPVLVPVSPEIYFDVDPRASGGDLPVVMIGPTLAAWLHLATVFVSALALGLHVHSGGRVRLASCVLASLGIAACLYHMRFGEADNLLRCGAWIAAVTGAIAALHLAEHEGPRRLIFAALLGLIPALLLQTLLYLLVEHPQTLRSFLQQQEQFLASRGWEVDSPQHRMYLRRIEQAEATGAFGLANVFGSVAAALTSLSLAATWGRFRDVGWPKSLGWALLSLAAIVLLLTTKSKGAIAVLLPACVLLTLGWRFGTRRAWAFMMGFLLLAILCVLLRGAMGPPTHHEGERSLLFRFHYLQGAFQSVRQFRGSHWLTGIGPDGFHQRYPQLKNPLSPEDVQSTHNVLADFTVMLGLGGAAWCVLLVMWRSSASQPPARGPQTNPSHAPTVALAVTLFTGVLLVRHAAMTIGAMLVWTLSLLSFIAVTQLSRSAGSVSDRALRVGLFVAASCLLVHNQIEMTFFHWGAAGIAWLTLAVAAAGSHEVAPQRVSRWIAPLLAMLLAAVMLVVYAGPITRQQSALAQAATAMRQGDLAAASSQLENALSHVPRSSRTYDWLVRLSIEQAPPQGPSPSWAMQWIERWREALPMDSAAPRLAAQIHLRSAASDRDAQALDRAIDALRRVVLSSPHSPQDRLRLADALWQSGRVEEAGLAYEQAMQVNERQYLDPLRQLRAAEVLRAAARSRSGSGI